MSSTTRSPSQSGQAIVVFTFSLTVLLLVAALAFDAGMTMLERRVHQDVADAAALAGVRYLPEKSTARERALELATASLSSRPSATVQVNTTSTIIEVVISQRLDSIFAAAVGYEFWDVRARAVAIKTDDQYPFAAMVALSKDACPAVLISGTGVVSSYGDIQVNSSCPDQAMKISGQGNLQLAHDGLGCYVVGGFQISGKAEGSYCDPPQQGFPINYPINAMPSNEVWPNPPTQVSGSSMAIPNGCPGSAAPATDEQPATCQFQSSYKGTSWRLYPGYYPGGIKLQGGTFYFEPGIYHLAGGGLQAAGSDVIVLTVGPGGFTLGGGILMFNTTHENFANGAIQLGGSGATFNLHPLGGLNEDCDANEELDPWERYLIFQDPAVTNEIVINGGSNDMSARGLIFAPTANVKVNGGTGTLTIDGIVADTFQINGNGGNINVVNDACGLPKFTAYGLIE